MGAGISNRERGVSHVRKQGLIARSMNGELVILDRASGYVHQLNAAASRIWDACDGTRSPEDIAHCVAAAFEDPPDAVRLLQDVRAALADFRRLGLLLDEQSAGTAASDATQTGVEHGND
jgi:hypothetical protein